jgi:hypothetical protein
VKTDDPAAVFDDLNALRRESNELAPPKPGLRGHYRRGKSVEKFARIPFDRARELGCHNVSATAWRLLIELDRLVFENGGRNPVLLTNHRMKTAGILRDAKWRALRQLKRAGVVSIQQGPGRAPLVTYHWQPIQ